MDGPTFKIERILNGGQRTDRFDVDAKLVADKDEPAQTQKADTNWKRIVGE